MAGSSNAFYQEGYKYPKSLLEINGRTLIDRVIDSLSNLIENSDSITFLIRKEDSEKYYLSSVIQLLVKKALVIEIPNNTAGAACSALLSIESIEEDKPLVIINGDQIINNDCLELSKNFLKSDFDAGCLTFKSLHPRWSYVKTDNKGYIIEAAEKKQISNNATAGFYFYRSAKLFYDGARKMILKDAHIEGKFFICPVFNELILDNKNLGLIEIRPNSYHSLMTPDLYRLYKESLTNA